MKKSSIQNILIGIVLVISGIIFLIEKEVTPYAYFVWHLKGKSAILLGAVFVVCGLLLLLYEVKKKRKGRE